MRKVIDSSADKIERNVQRFCSNVTEKLEDIEDKMEELGIELKVELSQISSKVDDIRDALGDIKRGRDNRQRRDEAVADHEISIHAITHMNPDNPLGSGGFGSVYLVTHQLTKKALKVVDLTGITPKKFSKTVKAFKNELAINCKIRHANIAIVYGGIFDEPSKLSMLMEYAPNGDLNRYIHIMQISVYSPLR